MSARQNLLSTTRQLSLVLDPTKLEAMTPADRNAAIERLASLLLSTLFHKFDDVFGSDSQRRSKLLPIEESLSCRGEVPS